jgi:hypothetical protein
MSVISGEGPRSSTVVPASNMAFIPPFSLFLAHQIGVLSTRQASSMPSQLIKRYKETAPMCYQRLDNSVAGYAQACVVISNELRDVGMLHAYPALNFLGNEFYAMYNAQRYAMRLG